MWRVSRALEDVLGQPVNANLYMTPPRSQGFEAHFDWMDGIVVQLAGSKTWIIYDEMVPFPRPDLKYKPASADLGEPIAVLELHPGDMLYIPRGWPHEAAVNGTGPGTPPPASAGGGPRRPSMHVTFGVETALAGTYESLLHHALEVAAVQHPLLFGLPGPQGEGRVNEGGVGRNSKAEKRSAHDAGEDDASVGEEFGVPWLPLLHLWVHEVASREKLLRKAVPLAPLFFPPVAPTETSHPAPSKGGTDDDDSDRGCVVEDRGIDGGTREGVCTEDRVRPPAPAHEGAAAAAPPEVLKDFQHALEACAAAGESDAGAAAVTLRLLELLLERGELDRVRTMFVVDEPSGGRVESDGSGGSAAAVSELDEELFARAEESKEWSRAVLEAFDRAPVSSSSLLQKIEAFLKVASPEAALRRMVLAAAGRARERQAITERDLSRCGHG